jgi:hypothetical protein
MKEMKNQINQRRETVPNSMTAEETRVEAPFSKSSINTQPELEAVVIFVHTLSLQVNPPV